MVSSISRAGEASNIALVGNLALLYYRGENTPDSSLVALDARDGREVIAGSWAPYTGFVGNTLWMQIPAVADANAVNQLPITFHLYDTSTGSAVGSNSYLYSSGVDTLASGPLIAGGRIFLIYGDTVQIYEAASHSTKHRDIRIRGRLIGSVDGEPIFLNDRGVTLVTFSSSGTPGQTRVDLDGDVAYPVGPVLQLGSSSNITYFGGQRIFAITKGGNAFLAPEGICTKTNWPSQLVVLRTGDAVILCDDQLIRLRKGPVN